MVAHSIAVRASQTAAEIGDERGLRPHELEGIHEVQVGDLEDRNDDAAIEEFNTIYQRWHEGDLDLRMPGGEIGHEVLDRYVPVITQLRMRYLDDDAWHGDIIVVSHGAAIRLAAATLAGVDGSFALDHHLPTPNPLCWRRSPTGGGAVCIGATRPRRSIRSPTFTPSRTPCRPPTRWADAQVQPIASQSMLNACITSGVTQPSSVHSDHRSAWWMTVPWQWSSPARHPRQSPCLLFAPRFRAAHGPF